MLIVMENTPETCQINKNSLVIEIKAQLCIFLVFLWKSEWMTIYIIGINYIQSFINLSCPVLKPVSRLTSFSSVVANLLMASMHVIMQASIFLIISLKPTVIQYYKNCLHFSTLLPFLLLVSKYLIFNYQLIFKIFHSSLFSF